MSSEAKSAVVTGGGESVPMDVPKTMRALVYQQAGTPDKVLALKTDVPVPVPADGEVLIKVSHCALNPVDYKVMGLPLLYPFLRKSGGGVIPCSDLAGTVVVSKNPRFHVGDDVVGYSSPLKGGAAAQYIALGADELVPRPKSLTAHDAASFPLAALTSLTVMNTLQLKPDAKLLVLGGSSATGAFGMQWAKRVLGVRTVAATCSANSAARCREFGADQTIDYRSANWWEELKGQQYDAVYDCVGGAELFDQASGVLKPGGAFATIAGMYPNTHGLVPLLRAFTTALWRKTAALFSATQPRYHSLMLQYSPQSFAQVAAAFDAPEPGRRLVPYVHGVFPFDSFQDAFALQQSQRAKGKLVLALPE